MVRRIAFATFILWSAPAGADPYFSVNSAKITELLRQPVKLTFQNNARVCVEQPIIENRAKALMSKYQISRVDQGQESNLFITLTGFKPSIDGAKSKSCVLSVRMELLTFTGGSGDIIWVTDGGIFTAPSSDVATGQAADWVQEFIEALVAKASD